MSASFPKFFRVRQIFDRPRVDSIPTEVDRQLARLQLHNKIAAGQSVAITVGSRGIANIDRIIKAAVDHLKGLGAKPFLVPAMGSHGGGTAAGQQAIVEGYGLTEAFAGCPIRSSMETVVVCRTSEGFPVHFDRHAYEADHVLVCGRIKPHTNFVGEVESGLMKMMLIGLGKHEGAKIYHRAIQDYSFGQIIRSVAGEVLSRCRIVAGLGIVENGYDETALVEAVAPADFERREGELLKLARRWMPKLPFDRADILLIDEIGKNISGAGMDTNVVGRKFYDHRPADDEWPKVKRICLRGLTEETHGNAAGVGMAEFCLQRAIDQVDWKITKINCLTGGHITGAAAPATYDTDREMLESALANIGLVEPPDARVLWIANTLHLAEVECSAVYLADARQRDDLEIISELRDLPLDVTGMLPEVSELGANQPAAAGD
ncbi:MAG: nickel-dependent lactate racemase [Pirellulales bacterium]|nr:nickel-dependent lactate racemase [Pirellulales bacterium]